MEDNLKKLEDQVKTLLACLCPPCNMRDPSLIILPVFTFLYKLYISSELTKIHQEIVSLLFGKHAWLAKVFNLDLFGLLVFFI